MIFFGRAVYFHLWEKNNSLENVSTNSHYMHSTASPQAMLVLIFVWRFVPDSIFLAFDFCCTEKTTTTATTTKWKTWIKTDGLLIRFTVLNQTRKKLLARSHFWCERRCKSIAAIRFPYAQFVSEQHRVSSTHFVSLLNTFFFWNKKCRKHIG